MLVGPFEDDVPEDPTDFLDLVFLVERTVLPVSTPTQNRSLSVVRFRPWVCDAMGRQAYLVVHDFRAVLRGYHCGWSV